MVEKIHIGFDNLFAMVTRSRKVILVLTGTAAGLVGWNVEAAKVIYLWLIY